MTTLTEFLEVMFLKFCISFGTGEEKREMTLKLLTILKYFPENYQINLDKHSRYFTSAW